MQEIKPPQKSMFYYALTIILFMMIVNAFIMPSLSGLPLRKWITGPS